jgi:hypothetical protein
MSGDGTIRWPALLVLRVVSIIATARQLLEAVPTTRQALRRRSASAYGVINTVLSHANWLSILAAAGAVRVSGLGCPAVWIGRLSAPGRMPLFLEVDGLTGQGMKAFL